MARKPSKSQGVPTPGLVVGAEPAGRDEPVARVRRHRADGRPEKGREINRRAEAEAEPAWPTDAASICQPRLGDAQEAVEASRGRVVVGSIRLRDDIPPTFKRHSAASPLAAGRTDEFPAAP